MPRAIEALSGDRKTFESANVVFTCFNRLKPNVFDAATISASTVVSWRGSAVMTAGKPSGADGSSHAMRNAASGNTTREFLRRWYTGPPGCDEIGVRPRSLR